MDLGIKGRKAIVCASSQGLGYACALALARAFLFKSIQFTTLCCYTLSGDCRRQIKQKGQIRLQMAMHPLFKRRELLPVQPAATALISIRSIAEPITDHPVTARQRRFDHLRQMLRNEEWREARFNRKAAVT